MTPLPLIFFHEGKRSRILETALRCARRAGCETAVLGGGELPSFRTFEEHFVNRSTNPGWIELLCFKRYYACLQYAEHRHLDAWMMLDNDVLVFDRFFAENFGKVLVGCAIPRDQSDFRMVASPHTSYWTIGGARRFVSFLDRYALDGNPDVEEKWRYHQTNRVSGGICDMTLLKLWVDTLPREQVLNLAAPTPRGVIDFCISTPEAYEKEAFLMDEKCGIKQMSVSRGQIWFTAVDGTRVPVRSLHAQGQSKSFRQMLVHGRCTPWRKRLALWQTRAGEKLDLILHR